MTTTRSLYFFIFKTLETTRGPSNTVKPDLYQKKQKFNSNLLHLSAFGLKKLIRQLQSFEVISLRKSFELNELSVFTVKYTYKGIVVFGVSQNPPILSHLEKKHIIFNKKQNIKTS